MRRRATAPALVLAAAVLLGGCGRGSGDGGTVGAGDLGRMSTERSLERRAFTATTKFGGHVLVVDGVVEDDYRYAATVRLDEQPVYEEVVVDDARYVRVLDAAALFSADDAGALTVQSPAAADLLTGKWVVDPTGAPPEFGAGTKPLNVPLAADLVLERVRYLEQLPELVKQEFKEYNTDAIYYMPKDDKFPERKADGKRFDHVPSPYDPNAITVTFSAIRKYFEYVSIWAKPDGITRIERLVTFPDPGDTKYRQLYRQIRQAGSRRLQNTLALGERGRVVAETYVLRDAGEADAVAAPADATPVPVTALLTALQARLSAAASPNPLHGRLE